MKLALRLNLKFYLNDRFLTNTSEKWVMTDMDNLLISVYNKMQIYFFEVLFCSRL